MGQVAVYQLTQGCKFYLFVMCCEPVSDNTPETHRHGHIGGDEDVEAHVELAPRNQVRVRYVTLHHVRFRPILLGLLPPTIRLPLADLAELGHNKNSSGGR